MFEFGVLSEVFGIDRTDDGVPAFDFRVCAERPGEPMQADGQTMLVAPFGLDAAADADLVAIPASRLGGPAVGGRQARRARRRRARRLRPVGLLGSVHARGSRRPRRARVHDPLAAQRRAFASAYPLAHVNPDVLYAHDGTVITSAGTAAGMDACLHLVRSEHGGAVANRIARRMVVSPHRDGGQRQFIDRPVPVTECESIGPVLQWLLEHLDEPHTVAGLARRASMSSRTFARRFVSETGTTPHQWVTDQRVLRAREPARGDRPVDRADRRRRRVRVGRAAAAPLLAVHGPHADSVPDPPPLTRLTRSTCRARPIFTRSPQVVPTRLAGRLLLSVP